MIPWYEKGLRFACTGCGKCCTGSPGYVFVSKEEIVAIAGHLEMELDLFCQKYIRQVGSRYSIKEHPISYDCLFLSGKLCTIYQVRPKQCSRFPFWEQNLASKEAWENVKKECEGINDEAPLISLEEIRERAR